MNIPTPSGRFVPGDPRRGTKPKGTRNKVATAFFDDLHAIWSEQGEAVLRRAAFEKPMEFAAMVAKLMPAKLEISTGSNVLTDEKYAELMDFAEAQLAHAASMTIEGAVIEIEGGGGSPQPAVMRGEVIDLIPTSAPHRDPVLVEDQPDFAAAPTSDPSSLPAEVLVVGDPVDLAGPADTPWPEDEVDPASLF